MRREKGLQGLNVKWLKNRKRRLLTENRWQLIYLRALQPPGNLIVNKLFLFFITLGVSLFGNSFADAPPNVPIPDNLNLFLQQNGYMVAQPRPIALAKTASWLNPIKFVVRVGDAVGDAAGAVYDGGQYVGSAITDGGQYVLSTANSVVQSVGDGVQWSATQVADGVDYVIIKTADATTWTIDTGLDGIKLVVRQTAAGVSWSVEKAVPDRLAIGGVTYVRLDPVKNVVKAGIGFTVKVSTNSLSAAQATTDYVVNTTAGLATGTVDLANGTLSISVDILTFAANNATAIASAMVDLDANKVATRVWSALLTAATNVLNWGDLGWCGSDNTWKNTLATNAIVTDYWPPDEQITNLVSFQAEQCRLFGLARLYKGCIIHDACYSVQGKTKQLCDDEIEDNWTAACHAAYGSGGYCFDNCRANIELFHYFLRTAAPGPFDDAQKLTVNNSAAATTALNNYNTAKTRYDYVSTAYPIFNKPQPSNFTPQKFITLLPNVAHSDVAVLSLLLQ